jgi:hypothetical protein
MIFIEVRQERLNDSCDVSQERMIIEVVIQEGMSDSYEVVSQERMIDLG